MLTAQLFTVGFPRGWLPVGALDVLRKNVKALIRQRDVNRTKLAAALQISRPSVSDFLNGKQGIDVRRLDDLARVLNVSVPDLFTPESEGTHGVTAGEIVTRELVSELQRTVNTLVGEVERLSAIGRPARQTRKAKSTQARGGAANRKRLA